MRNRISFLLLSLFFCLILSAQVTTEPAFITKGYSGEIKVIFNPALGSKGMVGATKCYAHTGLITEKSTATTDWKYATAKWRGGEDKYKMTKNGNNWELVIPNIYTYYGCPESEEIKQIAFVFNDGPNGSLEGKTDGNKDIFISLVEPGINVSFTEPTSNQLLTIGDTINFSATASEDVTLELFINETSVYSTIGTTLSYKHTFNELGNYDCVIKATGTTTAEDKINICIASSATEEIRPNGLLDGITYDKNDNSKVTLAIYAKDNKNEIAENIFVLGDFNNWTYNTDYQMKKDGSTGHFWLTIEGLESGKEYAFQYAVKKSDGSIVQVADAFAEKVLSPDDVYISDIIYPNLKKYPETGDGYVSILKTGKETFNWSDATLNFERPDKNNLVIYELWVHDFSSARSIDGITERLDYLENLGINAIELMPMSEFEGNQSWGYNPTFYFALDKAYGTSDAFKLLVDEAHKRGIAIIVDMVFNHATGLNSFNKLFNLADNPYFNAVAAHDHNVFEDFNHDFELTANHFVRVLNYWLDEYKIDGYRMDLSHGFCGPTCTTTGRLANIDNLYNNGVKAISPDAYFIMEHWEYSERASLVNKGMLCWENTNNAYSQTAMGWLKDGDNLNSANKDGYVSYTSSHDEERNFYKAQQWGNGTISTDENTRLSRIAANVAMSVMLNGPKMLWQFDELGYDFTIGENMERLESKPLPENNGFYTHPVRMAQYQKIGQMIQLRTRLTPETFEGNPTSSNLNSGQSQRFIYWGNSDVKVYIASNLSASGTTSFSLPDGATVWFDYFANNNTAITKGSSISLQPGEVKIYTSQYFALPEVPNSYDYVGTGVVTPTMPESNYIVYPTVTDGNIYIDAINNNYDVNIYNLWGQKVASFKAKEQVNIASLKQGMYLMVLTSSNDQEAFKIYRK